MEEWKMKATGIVRKIDGLGRIVLPKELRGVLDLDVNDPVEIFTDGEMIVLKKYNPGCVFCGETDRIKEFKGKNVCSKCRNSLK